MAKPPPPLSLPGIYGSLRKPTLRDVIYAAKAFGASALALLIGFAADLDNPYWAVLSIYIIVNPPGAGAIRLKCMFRLLGTGIGGLLVIGATGVFGDQVGILLAATIAIITGAMFLNQIDKTPANYIWFAVAVTAAVIALSNLMHPDRIYAITAARVEEISLGILAVAAVDCLWPEPQTPEFLKTMAGWRGKARDFALATIDLAHAPADDDARRGQLLELIKGIQAIDAKAIQLPFDVVPWAPRGRDLDLLRRQVVATVGDLVAIELGARPLREGGVAVSTGDLLDAISAWLRADAEVVPAEIDEHIARGHTLVDELAAARTRFDAAPVCENPIERGLLSRLAGFVGDWCDLVTALHVVETGERLSPRLRAIAVRAKPVRSVDYLGTALDLAPLVLAMSVASLIWYLTAWENGPTALLFSFAGCIFLVGQSQILESTGGFLTCILIAFALVFFYQFVVLPRITDFPMLLIVLGAALLPLGILMAMSMAGMLIVALLFSFLALQDAYRADFAQSLQTLVACLVGLLIAVVALRVCAYDHARFAARRLAAAVRRDVVDVARASRPPDRDRYRFLALYRLSLYFPAAEQAAAGGPLPPLGLLGDLSVGHNLLSLRRHEAEFAPGVRELVARLRDATVRQFGRKLAGHAADDHLEHLVDAAMTDEAVRAEPARDTVLDALAGLKLALRAAAGSGRTAAAA